MITLKNITKKFKDPVWHKVLNDVSLTLDKGDFAVITGASGSGKSTLLNILSGLDNEYEGHVEYDGVDIRKLKLEKFRKDKLGFVFQNFNLIPYMTVRENIEIAMNLDRSKSANERDKIIKDILEEVKLSDQIDKKVTLLSGGQKQRVAIARALSNSPEVIVADEPTGALDSVTAKEIMDIFFNLTKNGKTVVIVTHDHELKKYANKVFNMKDGKLNQELNKDSGIKSLHNQVEKKYKIGNSLLFKQAVKNFLNRKKRNIGVSIGASIGVIALLISLSIGEGVNNGIDRMLSGSLNPEEVYVFFDATGTGQSAPTLEMTSNEIQKAKNLMEEEGITEIYETAQIMGATLEYQGHLLTDNTTVPTIIEEANLKAERYESFNVENEVLLAGEMVKEQERGIVIKSQTAEKILNLEYNKELDEKNANEYLIGTNITVTYSYRDDNEMMTSTAEIPIVGIMNPNDETPMTNALISKQGYKELTTDVNIPRQIYMITGYADSAAASDAIVEKHKESKNSDYQGLIISNSSDFMGQLNNIVLMITGLLSFMSILSLVVAGVMLAVVLTIGVIERTREIGVLRALGYNKGAIRKIFLSEGAYIIVLSNIIAVLIVLLLSVAVNPLLENQFSIANVISLSISNILITLFATTIIGLLFAVIPAFKASNMNIVQSLRYE